MNAPASKSFWQKYQRLFIGVTVLVALGFAVRHFQSEIPECSSIQSQIQGWGVMAPVVFFLVYVVATVAFVPGTIVTLFAGLAFGVWWGTALVSLSSMGGATLAFLAARYIARDAVEGLLSKQGWFTKFKAGIEENGFNFVLFVRLAPIFPFNGLNYACGLVPLKLKDYLLGSFIGMLPGTFVYVYLGETGCKLIDPIKHGEGLPPEVRMRLIGAFALLAFLSVVPLLLKRLRKGKAPPAI